MMMMKKVMLEKSKLIVDVVDVVVVVVRWMKLRMWMMRVEVDHLHEDQNVVWGCEEVR